MTQLKVIKVKPSQIAKLEEDIKKAIIDTLYMPLLKEMNKTKRFLLKNDKSYIQQAIIEGRIKIANGVVKGSFNSKIIKEFNSLGYNYDKRIDGFRVTLNKLTPAIQSAVAYASTVNEKNAKVIQGTLDNIDVNIDVNKFVDNFDSAFETLDVGVTKSLKAEDIYVDITSEQKKVLSQNYSKNLSTYIKDFVNSEILTLRDKISKAFIAGQRAESLEDFIKDRFSVSGNKARFLARQEMSLASSQYREDRYKRAGVKYYKWSTSKDERVRDDHADLDGHIFNYDDPPIIDKRTGQRGNPGEAFGCRCVAIPVINEVEE